MKPQITSFTTCMTCYLLLSNTYILLFSLPFLFLQLNHFLHLYSITPISIQYKQKNSRILYPFHSIHSNNNIFSRKPSYKKYYASILLWIYSVSFFFRFFDAMFYNTLAVSIFTLLNYVIIKKQTVFILHFIFYFVIRFN